MKQNRFISLDIFRGVTMIMMTIVNNPGDWSFIYPPLEHAEWHGCTPTDLVFPFFIFAMGASIPFSLPQNSGLNSNVFKKILTRSLRIVCLGLLLNFFSKIHIGNLDGFFLMIIRVTVMYYAAKVLLTDYPANQKLQYVLFAFLVMMYLAFGGIDEFKFVRIPGVLQRIGIVYFCVAMLYLGFDDKKLCIIGIAILIIYYVLMAYFPMHQYPTGSFAKGRNLAAMLDNKLLKNHLWVVSKTWDPEGILSTFPAVVSGIIGVWAGKILKSGRKNLVQYFLMAGVSGLVLGKIWGLVFPINKALWSSSFVLFTAGWALILMAILFYIYEQKHIKTFSRFFSMWGINPMIVFFISGILPRALAMISFKTEGFSGDRGIMEIIYQKMYLPWFENYHWASLLWAIGYVAVWSVALKYFKNRNWIFKV